MNTEQQYHDFLLLLTEDEQFSRELSAELLESDSNPNQFFAKHETGNFWQRGVKSGNKRQALLFMIDRLMERNLMWELDHKPDTEELNYAIQEMSGGKFTDLVDEEEEEDAQGMFELLDTAEELLAEEGFGILHLDIDSDSHPIALVKLDKLKRLDEMTEKLFYTSEA